MAPRTPKDPEPKSTKPAKPAAKAKPALKAATKAAPPKAPSKVSAAGASASVGLKLRDLVEEVATATGAKKPDAKKAVEATLAAIATALKSGNDLALQPLGKLRVVKTMGNVLTLKLRQQSADKSAAKPLANDGEDD